MLLSKEELKKGLEPEQIQAIEAEYSVKEAELLALANKNADGIFNGAAEKLNQLTNIQKNEKEKFSDYFERLGTEWLPEVSKAKITKAEQEALEWKGKFENHKGDETFKIELEQVKAELAKFPDILKAKDEAWETKYSSLETTHNTSKLNRSITDAMPKFDDNVNKFELEAKKKSAIERIKNTHELSYDEKDNLIGTKDYQKFLISDLLKQDAELKDLILIEQKTGGGGQGSSGSAKTLNIPESISKGAAQEIIKQHIITNENIDHLDDKFAARFKELCKENDVL